MSTAEWLLLSGWCLLIGWLVGYNTALRLWERSQREFRRRPGDEVD